MISAIAITGPTASGKTALSIALARRLGCEIICCDSMQIYRRMDIGTAKVTKEEQSLVPHYMFDICDPTENYSAEDYREAAIERAREISERGMIPMFVGGTGLYIDTVMRGAPLQSPPSDRELHASLIKDAESEEGKELLWQRLNSVDPASAEKIHKNNVRRVARALEIYLLSGRTKTDFDLDSQCNDPDVSVQMLTLDFLDRELLYKRVDHRVDLMMEQGLLSEVEALFCDGMLDPSFTASAAIGYKELVDYLEGRCSLQSAVETIKLSSRRYAKRQLTWFRHERDALRLFVDREDGSMKSEDELICEAMLLLGRA